MKLLKQFTLVAASVAAITSGSALASSHREAPQITEMPKVDSTDFYMFQSYEDAPINRRAANKHTTLIANYQPFQLPGGGPNYFAMDEDALYEIHIDNTGDGVEDITFQFDFDTTLTNNGTGTTLNISGQTVPIPLINVGPGPMLGVTAANTNAQNRLETYSVKVVRGDRRTGTAADVTLAVAANGQAVGATEFRKPLDYIGRKTFGGAADGNDSKYQAYADAHIYTITIPGCPTGANQGRMFVGQRKEGFVVNIGPIFDLVNAPATTITNPGARGAIANNPIGIYNISTIALEIPTDCLVANPAANPAQPVIGGWQTASKRQARAFNPAPTFSTPDREGGAWTQVSRLGMPLVNEVVIGLKDKNLFNSIKPASDSAAALYVTHPTLPALIEALFMTPAPKIFPRADLVAVFAQGVPGVNVIPGNANVIAEMQRLNTAIAPTAGALQNNLGAAACFVTDAAVTTAGSLKKLDLTGAGTSATGCDPAGFPNGRRPGDDVVDIALTVSMGYLFNRDVDAPSRGTLFHDAILADESQFLRRFPYLQYPIPGATTGGQ